MSERAMRAAMKAFKIAVMKIVYKQTGSCYDEIAAIIDRERRDAAEGAVELFADAPEMLSDEDVKQLIDAAVEGKK